MKSIGISGLEIIEEMSGDDKLLVTDIDGGSTGGETSKHVTFRSLAESLREAMYDVLAPIKQCRHCSSWGAVKMECPQCGAVIQPEGFSGI